MTDASISGIMTGIRDEFYLSVVVTTEIHKLITMNNNETSAPDFPFQIG